MARLRLVAWTSICGWVLISPACWAADYYKIDPEHTSVVFSIGHAGLSFTYGMFREVSGQYLIDKTNPANCRFQLVIRADSIDTNNAERDKRLRGPDFFNVEQFPELRFDSVRCEAAGTPDGSVVYKLTGNLTIHGVTRQVTSLPLRMLGEGPGAAGNDHRTGFLCQTELKRSDFGMTNLLDKNLVGDAVGITVSFEGVMQEQPPAPRAGQ